MALFGRESGRHAAKAAVGGSEILHLRDGSTITFGGVTGLTQSSFV